MSRKDIYHDTVKKALSAEGWVITADPLYIKFGGAEIYIDLGAEQLLGAEKDGQYIAVEIKSFIGKSTISEFYTAAGQFMSYRLVLAETYPERILYLAVPYQVYVSFFDTQFGRLAIQQFNLKLIVYKEKQGVIAQWVK